MKFQQSLCYFFLCSLFLVRAHAANYYVSSFGNDENPGTQELPWKSIEKVNATTLLPGDGIYFQGGESFWGSLVLHESGTNENPIVIGSYGQESGRAILQSESAHTISGFNVGGFRIENLILTGSGEKGSGVFFFTDDATGKKYPGITISHVEVFEEPENGINIGSWTVSNPGWEFLKVTEVNLHDNNDTGMATYGYTVPGITSYAISTIEVSQSEFHHNASSGLVICGAAGGLVKECIFHDNQSTGGCWTWGASHITIEHCLSFNNKKGDQNDGFGFDLDGGSQYCTIQYCLSYNNETPGFVIFDYPQSATTTHNTIRYCVSENDCREDKEWGSFEMLPWGDTPIKNCHIYNCVAYLTSRSGSTTASGFEIFGRQSKSGYGSGKTRECSFCNNVIYLDKPGSDSRFFTCNQGANHSKEIVLQNNIFYSSENNAAFYFKGQLYTDFEEWQRLFPNQGKKAGRLVNPNFSLVGTGSEIKDPKELAFITSYRPVADSPCLDQGLDLNQFFGIHPGCCDFSGNELSPNGPFSIGVF